MRIRFVFFGSLTLFVLPTMMLIHPQSQDTNERPSPLLRLNGTYVWVPALVKDKTGKPVTGVDVNGMRLSDNGSPEKVSEIDMHGLPISLVILVQTGRSGRILQSYANLPELIFSMAGNSDHEITLVTFDSRVEEIWRFPSRMDGVDYALTHLHPGDSGAAIKDALAFGVRQLQAESGRFRRIVLLLSQLNDVGSSTSSQSLLEELGTSSTIVYSLTFPGGRNVVRGHKMKRTGLMINAREETSQALDDQTAEEASALTGGSRYPFKNEGEFDSAMTQMLSDFHSGITFGFQPSRHEVGFHSIELKAVSPKLRVTARRAYWSVGSE